MGPTGQDDGQDDGQGGRQPRRGVLLWWLPVGAGGHLVRHTSRCWELLEARREHRPARALVHSALEVVAGGRRHLVEMAPQWSGPRAQQRGVVLTGPVGSRLLGRSRAFRYEVRCWPDGVLADRRWALTAPVLVAADEATAAAVLRQVARAPALTWGRPVSPGGDMWNSNSLISWTLATGGVPTGTLSPPPGTRAPGWDAGLALARLSPR